jgi:hypothetical protein
MREGSFVVQLRLSRRIRGLPGQLLYGASKAAVVMLTKELALELAPHRIRLNAIAPGWVDTAGNRATGRMAAAAASIPLGRVATAEEIARWVLLLTGPDADHRRIDRPLRRRRPALKLDRVPAEGRIRSGRHRTICGRLPPPVEALARMHRQWQEPPHTAGRRCHERSACLRDRGPPAVTAVSPSPAHDVAGNHRPLWTTGPLSVWMMIPTC